MARQESYNCHYLIYYRRTLLQVLVLASLFFPKFLPFVCASSSEYTCEDVCNLILLSEDAENASKTACSKHRNDIPRPLVHEMCLGVFMSTKESACLHACDEHRNLVEDTCTQAARSSPVNPRTSLKACKTGREMAIKWMKSTFKSFSVDAGIEVKAEEPRPEPPVELEQEMPFEPEKEIEIEEKKAESEPPAPVVAPKKQKVEEPPAQPEPEPESEPEPGLEAKPEPEPEVAETVEEETPAEEISIEKGAKKIAITIDGEEKEIEMKDGQPPEDAILEFCSKHLSDSIEECVQQLGPLLESEMS